MKKRILSILLAALMLLSAVPLGMVDTAWAAETEVVASGSCGLNVKWVLTSDGTLTISGKTRIDDYGIGGAPWYNLRQYIKKVAIQNGVQAIGDCAFSRCTLMTSVMIPDSVTSIGEYAFSGCSGLTSVTIPKGVTRIENSAFRDCASLTSVTIPRSVTSIGAYVFSGGNIYLNVDPDNSAYCSIDGALYSKDRTVLECAGKITGGRFIIPTQVTCIGDGAFMSCRNLTSVTIPDSVTSICRGAFSGCSNLASVTIPDSVTYLDAAVFVNCTALQSVKIPDGVDFIQPDTFNNCTALTSVTIPDSVTFIGQYAFSGCSGLTSVKIPNGVFGIREHAFHGCTSLTSVTIPSGLASINEWTFSNCVRLAKVTIPKSVTSIGVDAFSNCDSLTDVYYAGTAADWAKISISEGNEDLTSAALRCAPASLSAPSVTGGNDSQGRPTLKWNAVTGAAKYEVYRARSRSGEYIKYSTVTGTSYTNTSYIENGNTYYYKVRALDANGAAGAWSSIVSVTYKQTLLAPSVTGGNDAQGRPTLKWKAVTGAAKYEVYRARSMNGDYIKYSTVTGTSYTNISYIENGNTYYYKVRALDANGRAGAWSSIVSVTYKQTLPAPTVTGGNDAQGRPTLKWNAVSGAAKYEVYRARSKDGDYIKYSTVTGTSYTNTSYIEDGNTYYYKVRALDANGTAGAWSSIVSVTYRAASTGTLSAPSVTGGKDSQGRPTLTWNAVTGAAKYEVYRARSKDGDYIKYSTVTGTSYTNTSYIESGNTYYYKVRALKSDGTAGAWSSIVSVTYRAASTGTLPAPAVTGGNDAQGRPTLTWKAVTGAAKYEVYRARSKDGTYTKYSTTTGTAYTNSSYLTSGATYYYKVRALDANGNAGPYSAVVSVTCRLKLTAPTVTGSTDSQGRPTLKWNAVTGAAKYEVYRARSKDGDYIKYSTVTGTSYTNTSYLENGNTYYYKVRALGSDGTAGPDSTPVSVTYKAPFGAPLVTGSKDSQGRPALKWDKVTDAAKYEVYRARSKDGTYSLMSTQSATGYTNTSYLANGTTYYYKVRALKANGTASAYSSVVTITYGTVPTPAAPAMRSAKADSAGITVSWDTAANAVTYNVYRTADAGSSWTQVASSIKGTSYKDTTVQKGVKYGYKVRGVAADGKTLGPMSSTGVTAKVTAASTTPDYVKLKSAKSDPGNGILLTWESAADAKTYNVYRKVDGASGWTLLASSVSGTSYRDTSGKRGTTYVYTVRGVAADGKTLSRTYNTDGLRATVR